MVRLRLSGSTAFLAILVLAVLVFAWSTISEGRKLARSTQSTPSPTISADDPSLGPESAQVIIVEYGDFQCPACKAVQPDVALLLAKYSGRVRLVWKDFPVSSQHPQALAAAVAARCAHEQGKFWEMHDRLFEEQDNFDAARYTEIAQALGLQLDSFTACMNTSQTTQRITTSVAEAVALGVDGVPTLYVNGVRQSNTFDIAQLEAAIQMILRQP